jgi:methionyl-tRNA formyltransferase
MRIVLVGQQDFGKAALEAFLARGDEVAGVFCAPEAAGARPDPLAAAARERGLRLFQLPSLRGEEPRAALAGLEADLGIMAYVLQFAPQSFVTVPRLGTIQFHPSLLPRYRGPSSINWPIIRGDTQTGLTIFRPTDGLDEGPVVLQKQVPIGPDDTLGSVYFERLFPLGVQALLEAADLVGAGQARASVQDEGAASYEGWCRSAESRIHWSQHLDLVYNLVRGCNPAPGAWTTVQGRRLQIFDARRHPARRFAQVRGKPGQCVEIGAESMRVCVQGGELEIQRVRPEEGKKLTAAEYCSAAGLRIGELLGT